MAWKGIVWAGEQRGKARFMCFSLALGPRLQSLGGSTKLSAILSYCTQVVIVAHMECGLAKHIELGEHNS